MMLITIAIAVISAMGWHALMRKYYWIASFGSTVTTLASLWLIAASHMRISDVAYIAAIAFGIAIVVGRLFNRFKQINNEKR